MLSGPGGSEVSTWLQEASDLLPELKAEFEEVDSQMGMWLEVQWALEHAYERTPRDEDLIARIYSMALGTEHSGDDETLTAVAFAFFEHLPLHPAVWADLHRWLPIESFEKLEEVFKYHLSASEFEERKQDFLSRAQGHARDNSRPNHGAG